MSETKGVRVRGILLGLGISLGLLGVTAAVSAPGIVENSMNKIDYFDYAGASEEALALHSELTIVDMHADTLLWDRDLTKQSYRGHVDLPRLQQANVAIQVFSSVSKTPKGQNYDSNSADSDNITLLSIVQGQPIRTWNSPLQRSLFHAKKLEAAAKDSNGKLQLIHDRGELADFLLEREGNQDLVGALFSVEGLHNLEGDFKNIQKLFDAGMRMAGFTHFFDNELAGSMHGEKKGGLTEFGEKTFDELQRLGVIIDIAHASPAAVDDMLKRATRPVVSSHGGVQGTCMENRNLSDDQIRGVAATNGVIGIGFWDAAVCDTSPKAVVDAIDHVVEIGGIETAALGSDFDGAVTVGWDVTGMDLITHELLERGYTPEEIRLIMGGNTIRVFNDVLPESFADHEH
ncbi:MAG: peptidase M19 [Actinomycetales bacterium]|nr:peptidase M19 [Actinomycetales bacterium]